VENPRDTFWSMMIGGVLIGRIEGRIELLLCDIGDLGYRKIV
jgi:hypothetical protein